MSDDKIKAVIVHPFEDPEDNRRLYEAFQRTPFEPPGEHTLTFISAACTRQIDRYRAASVSQMQVQRELAVYWLQAQRPWRLGARLRWLWHLLRALW